MKSLRHFTLYFCKW